MSCRCAIQPPERLRTSRTTAVDCPNRRRNATSNRASFSPLSRSIRSMSSNARIRQSEACWIARVPLELLNQILRHLSPARDRSIDNEDLCSALVQHQLDLLNCSLVCWQWAAAVLDAWKTLVLEDVAQAVDFTYAADHDLNAERFKEAIIFTNDFRPEDDQSSLGRQNAFGRALERLPSLVALSLTVVLPVCNSSTCAEDRFTLGVMITKAMRQNVNLERVEVRGIDPMTCQSLDKSVAALRLITVSSD